jgi:hypothetical protein
MSNPIHTAEGSDLGFITISEDFDVRYWTKEFDVNEQQLLAVVRSVGTSVVTVRARLQQLGRM